MIMVPNGMDVNINRYAPDVTPAWMKADHFDQLVDNQPRKHTLRNRFATLLKR